MAPVWAGARAVATPDSAERHPASFRDPSGFIFTRGGVLYRQVQSGYREHYDRLISTGLLGALVRHDWIVAHEEVSIEPAAPGAYKILRPATVDLVSYPFEWSFSQLKDAALLTLRVQACALEHGMVLKDASAYNVQFHSGRPIFIDTLSFENHVDGQPWQAYRQFCQHFLAPLALMAKVDIRLGQLLRVHLDGIPLDLASRLLPRRTWLTPGLAMHLHAHAAAQRRYAGAFAPGGRSTLATGARVSRTGLAGIVDSLQRTVGALDWTPAGTEWADYESTHGYGDEAHAHKRMLVTRFFESISPAPRRVLDLGANTGLFSRLLAATGATVVSADGDPAAVERNYRRVVQERTPGLLPLLVDLTNPTSGLGWAGEERTPLTARVSADATLCLALVHHLSIGNNVPFDRLAGWLAATAPVAIVEFVPKDDPQVQRLLASREDVFADYHAAAFEGAFAAHFAIRRKEQIAGSGRTLYLMTAR
jgi:ribosomal protein L11 methylase PrmA